MKIDIPVISETIITGTAYGRRKGPPGKTLHLANYTAFICVTTFIFFY